MCCHVLLLWRWWLLWSYLSSGDVYYLVISVPVIHYQGCDSGGARRKCVRWGSMFFPCETKIMNQKEINTTMEKWKAKLISNKVWKMKIKIKERTTLSKRKSIWFGKEGHYPPWSSLSPNRTPLQGPPYIARSSLLRLAWQMAPRDRRGLMIFPAWARENRTGMATHCLGPRSGSSYGVDNWKIPLRLGVIDGN